MCYVLPRRRQWHPTPVLLPGNSHGKRSLVGCSPWGLESQTWLSDFTFTFHFHFPALEKEMATHSSVLSWRTSGTGADIYGVAQSWTRLKRLSSSSSSMSSLTTLSTYSNLISQLYYGIVSPTKQMEKRAKIKLFRVTPLTKCHNLDFSYFET